MPDTTIRGRIKELINVEEYDSIIKNNNISIQKIEEILDVCIAFNLAMLIKSDYRDHLMISELITSYKIQKNKNALYSLTEVEKYVDNHEFEKLLFKNKSHLLKNEIVSEFNVTTELSNKMVAISIVSVILYLNNLTREKKLNVRGIVQNIESENYEIYKLLNSNFMKIIKQLSMNNRKRTTTYQRGAKENKYSFNFNYIIAMVIVIICAYFYLYLL